MSNENHYALKNCIRSYIPGRMRLRHFALVHLDNHLCQMIQEQLMLLDGMKSVEVNPRVGSLLLCWDRSILSSEELLSQGRQYWQMLMMFSSIQNERTTTSLNNDISSPLNAIDRISQQCRKQGNRILDLLAPYIAHDVHKGARARRVTQNRLMLASLAISMGVLVTSNKMLHTVAGSIFLGFLGIHLLQHKKVL